MTPHTKEFCRLVESSMSLYGLTGDGVKPNGVWTYEFDRARKRLGQCRYADRVLSFSLPYVEINTIDNMRNTVLHEIAHALCGIDGVSDGHGPNWQAMAESIGAKPERCNSDPNILRPSGPYVFNCRCGAYYFHRENSFGQRLTCRKCNVTNVVALNVEAYDVIADTAPDKIVVDVSKTIAQFNRFTSTLPAHMR